MQSLKRPWIQADLAADLPAKKRTTSPHADSTASVMATPDHNFIPRSNPTRRYRARDAHEAFFRPPANRAQPPRKVNSKFTSKRQKPRPWTNKERAQFAREHWLKHHANSPGQSSSTLWCEPATPPTPDPSSPTSSIWCEPAPNMSDLNSPIPSPPSTISETFSSPSLFSSPTILGHQLHYQHNGRTSLSFSTPSPTDNQKSFRNY